jgi:cytidylate kinase
MAVISISRQFGAGGETLSEMLAERLGYEFVDRELINKVAKAADISIDLVEAAWKQSGGKKTRGLLSGLINTDALEGVVGRVKPEFSENDFYALLENIIPEVAQRDKVIFLGRASQFILPDERKYIKILLVAHQENRYAFMMDRYDMTRSEATKMVKDWDRSRINFLSKFTKGDPNDLSNYDLTINTDKVKHGWAVDMIVDMVNWRDKTAH